MAAKSCLFLFDSILSDTTLTFTLPEGLGAGPATVVLCNLDLDYIESDEVTLAERTSVFRYADVDGDGLGSLRRKDMWRIVEKDVCEIQEIELAFRPGQGGVEPTQPFEVNAVFGHESLVDDDRWPLSTLAFVACQRVREFDLKRLVAGVGVGGFVDFGLAPEMGVVGAHGVVQRLSFCSGL